MLRQDAYSAKSRFARIVQFTRAIWNVPFAVRMEAEFQLLEGMVEGYKDNKKKHALHSSKMGDIKRSLNQLTLNIGANNYVWNILPSAIVALEFMAADMPEEQGVGPNELEEIRRLCEELRTEIHGCDSLNRTLKEWLLDLVRLMREGIDRYQIRGSRGLRRQFHEMVGSMVDNYDLLKEVKEKGPTVWQKVSKVVELVHKASELGEKATKALGSVTSAVCSRIAYSDQKRPWCSYLLPAGEAAPQGRMRAELLALASKSPHPAVPARPRKRGSPRSPREKERRPAAPATQR